MLVVIPRTTASRGREVLAHPIVQLDQWHPPQRHDLIPVSIHGGGHQMVFVDVEAHKPDRLFFLFQYSLAPFWVLVFLTRWPGASVYRAAFHTQTRACLLPYTCKLPS